MKRAIQNLITAAAAEGMTVSYDEAYGKIQVKHPTYGTLDTLRRAADVWIRASAQPDGRWQASTTPSYHQRTGYTAAQHRTLAGLARLGGVATYQTPLKAVGGRQGLRALRIAAWVYKDLVDADEAADRAA